MAIFLMDKPLDKEKMYEAIDKYGLSSEEALEASQELDKHIAAAQRQRVLTKEEFMSKVVNDLDKHKRAKKQNEADCYIWDKAKMVGKKAIKHKQRQPHWRSK